MSQSLITICPSCKHEEIYKGKAKRPRITCDKCHIRYYIKDPNGSNKTHKKSNFVPPQTKITHQPERVTSSPSPIIDDPDELLYSVAIRELNKPQPDPRWASILIQCRKEIGKRKDEMVDQLQKLPTKQLIEILEKQSGQSLLKESTN